MYTIPAYVDRNEITAWCGGNELMHAEFERRVELAKEGFTSVLAENIGHKLGDEALMYH